MNEPAGLAELQTKAEEARVDFLQTDLTLCFTFADVFQTEMEAGHLDDARHMLATTEEGYSTISRFLPRVENQIQRDEIAVRLNSLKERLDHMRTQLPA
jgi:hypothetical protein